MKGYKDFVLAYDTEIIGTVKSNRDLNIDGVMEVLGLEPDEYLRGKLELDVIDENGVLSVGVEEQ